MNQSRMIDRPLHVWSGRLVRSLAVTFITLFITPVMIQGCTGGEETPPRRSKVRQCGVDFRVSPQEYPTELIVEIYRADEMDRLTLAGRYPLSPIIDEDTLKTSSVSADSVWSTRVELAADWYEYRFLVDGEVYVWDENALDAPTLSTQRGNEQFGLIEVKDCHIGRWYRADRRLMGKGQQFTLAYERGSPMTEEITNRSISMGGHVNKDPSSDGVALDPESLALTIDESPWPFELSGEVLTFSTESLANDLYLIRLTGTDILGQAFEPIQGRVRVTSPELRGWGAPLYQVVLDRLDPPQDPSIITQLNEGVVSQSPSIAERWGGSLNETLALLKEGYFEEFGIGTIWLSPVYPNPDGLWTGVEGGSPRYEGYHGYWPIESRAVGPEWGGELALENLVTEAHHQGIKVILDVVLNHVHEQHPYIEQFPAWFTPRGCYCGQPGCGWGEYIERCWFTPYLPDLRWEGQAALTTQVEDALWFMSRFKLDGLRVDAVPMMPRSVTRLLSHLAKDRFESLGDRVLLIGETFTGPREWDRLAWYLGPSGLDGQFDFSLMWAIREVFAWGSMDFEGLIETFLRGEESWNWQGVLMGRFIGNQDLSRFSSEAASTDLSARWERPPPQLDASNETGQPYLNQWLAQAFVFTLPGVPVLYYGDEVGLAGANDPDNRRPFWPREGYTQGQEELRRKVAQVGRIRRCHLGLQNGKFTLIKVTPNTLIFSRSDGQSHALITVTKSVSESVNEQKDSIVVRVPPPLDEVNVWKSTLNDALMITQDNITQDNSRLTLPLTYQNIEIYLPETDPCLSR